MKTNKNIDRLFQEKLKDFEVSPPDTIWKGIERDLNTNKSTSIFPSWLLIGSAVAVLIFLTIGGVNYFNSESSDINNNTIVNDSENDYAPNINIEDSILKKDILNSTDNGNAVAETENDDNINVTNSDKAPKINKESLKKDVLNSTKNRNLITGVDNNSNINSPGSDNENTPEINKESLKRDVLNSTENGNVIAEAKNYDNTVNDSDKKDTPKINKEILKSDLLKSDGNVIADTENNENKNNALTNKMVLDGKRQNNSEQEQQQNSKNTIAKFQSKKATNDFVETNSKNNLKNTSDTSIATINDSFKTEYLNESQSDKIAGSLEENLTNSNEKLLSDQINLNETSEVENTVADTAVKELEPLEDVLKITEEEKDNKKWSVASIFGPVYYNSFTEKTSPLDPQFVSSPKKGSKSASYGLNIEYRLNKKLSLRSGVALVNVGYEIRDVFINPSQQLQQKLVNVDYNNNVVILSINATNFLNNNQLETLTSTPTKGVLNQEFGYIEVPLELKYKLNNSKKIGVNLIGGFSTLFLNKNEVSVETSTFTSSVGEANNLNNINFSGNLGFDFDYKINKNLYLNVAPMLKIHTSTFSKNADNFKPYTLGVYSGLNYKF